MRVIFFFLCVFFFNDTATTEIYTLSLHDALPIFVEEGAGQHLGQAAEAGLGEVGVVPLALAGQDRVQRVVEVVADRKSTRLNSSHANISYAVFCLKKKK